MGDAYWNQHEESNFWIWVLIFGMPTCFQVRNTMPCPSVSLSVRLYPRTKIFKTSQTSRVSHLGYRVIYHFEGLGVCYKIAAQNYWIFKFGGRQGAKTPHTKILKASWFLHLWYQVIYHFEGLSVCYKVASQIIEFSNLGGDRGANTPTQKSPSDFANFASVVSSHTSIWSSQCMLEYEAANSYDFWIWGTTGG